MRREERSDRVLEMLQGALQPELPRGPVVMVHPNDGFVSEPCVKAAAGIAHLLHGAVLGVGRGPSAEHEELLDGLTEAAAYRFREILRETRAEGRWRTITKPTLRAVQDFAHEADLIVTARGDEPSFGPRYAHVRKLLTTTGRPVFVCGGDRPVRFDRTLVCWNDSPQARRAVVDALPLLRRSRLTVVVLVCEAVGRKQVEPRAHEVERGLRERGVKARAVVRTFEAQRLSEIVRDAADEEDADLVVAGAYGRGPIWRTATGSHTDALLGAVNRPMLLSH